MKKVLKKALIVVITLVTVSCGPVFRPSETTVGLSQSTKPENLAKDWEAFLRKNVSVKGEVDYERVSNNPEELEKVYRQIARLSPRNAPELFPSEEEKFAYWLNAYNIAVIRGVNEHYPIASVLEVKPFSVFSLIEKGGFFVGQKFVFGGQEKHLYEVENGVIRKGFVDPRFHFAINCASESCPPLAREAFRGERLEEQLEKVTRDFINSPRALIIDDERKQIALSELFDWYREEFVAVLAEKGIGEGVVLDYLSLYLRADRLRALQQARQQGYKVTFQPYDWSLNGKRSSGTAL